MSAAKIVRQFDNGAKTLELDGIRFTVSHTGRISWACPEGWARIAVDRETFPIMETYTVWQPYGPTYNDDEYTYSGPIDMDDTFTIDSRVFPLAQLREAVDWKRDCQSIPDSVFVSFPGALQYVERNYPGGWDTFVAECCTFVQL